MMNVQKMIGKCSSLLAVRGMRRDKGWMGGGGLVLVRVVGGKRAPVVDPHFPHHPRDRHEAPAPHLSSPCPYAPTRRFAACPKRVRNVGTRFIASCRSDRTSRAGRDEARPYILISNIRFFTSSTPICNTPATSSSTPSLPVSIHIERKLTRAMFMPGSSG